MHIYIYDNYVNNKKYDAVIAQVETRITDLGLNGKIIRLGLMKNIFTTVENEIKYGAKTITAVGNNKTFNQVINAVLNTEIKNSMEINIPIGFIPIGQENNSIAEGLGIKEGEEACDALSARRIEQLDVAKANHVFFLSQATISSQSTILEIAKNYSIEILDPGEINIINLSTAKIISDKIKSNPQDGILELHIRTKKPKKLINLKTDQNQSFFSLKKLTIKNNKLPLMVDNALE
ncbi:MAG: diacylglycerol kinase family protein, partial [Patescibacteria group bacterium]